MGRQILTELLRQTLRWVGVWLMSVGAPSELQVLLERPEVLEWAVGASLYLLADGAWLWGYAKKVKVWLWVKMGWGF